MKIPLFDIPIRLSEIDKEFHRNIEMLIPVISKIDATKISNESGLTYDGNYVNISIIPKQYEFAELNIFIGRRQLVSGFAESEQYEDHRTNKMRKDFIEPIEKYLNGIRIKAYYNKKGRILKREYFYKDNTGIGTSQYSFNPFSRFSKKIEKEISISFYSV